MPTNREEGTLRSVAHWQGPLVEFLMRRLLDFASQLDDSYIFFHVVRDLDLKVCPPSEVVELRAD